jgi:hypothetical protein
MQTAPTGTSAAKRLATLAVLRAHWSEGKQSYVDTFLPFALEAVRLEGGAQIPLDDIRSRMEAEFGITLPIAALQIVLRGARSSGYGVVRGGAFVPEAGLLSTFDTAGARQVARREQASLIERLVESAGHQDLNWTIEDAAEAIANYLDRHSTSLLVSSHGQDLNGEEPPELEDDPREFVVASFFSSILEKEPEAARYLEHLVVGTMLASALYTPDLDRIEDPLACDVYLDTPALIDALGHAGSVLARAARESIALLQEAGARVKCFDHTAVEIDRKLCDVAEQLRDRRKRVSMDPIIENAVARKRTPEDLEQAAGRVHRELQRLKITLEEAPPRSKETNIDEVAAEKILMETLGHTRRNTIQFDLDSLTGVHRLRGGRRKHRIEGCTAVFATPHGRLVGASRQIFPAGRDVPVAVGLADLVTLAWLKKPRAMPELPRLRIAADCYATVQPSPGLVRRYVDEAVKLHKSGSITEDDLYELRYGMESKRILMVRTKGATSAVNAEAVEGILDERNRQIAARARLDAERDANAVRVQLDAERAARESDKADFEARIESLEDRARKQEDRLGRVRAAEVAAIDLRAGRQARWIVRPVAYLAFAIAVIVALLTVPFVGDQVAAPIGLGVLATMPHAIAWIVRAFAIAIAVAVLVLNMWGSGFGDGMTVAEEWFKRLLKARAMGRASWPKESD